MNFTYIHRNPANPDAVPPRTCPRYLHRLARHQNAQLLTREENLVGLMAVSRELIGQAEILDHADRVVLDMDSSESPVHGQQEGTAYNGHFETVCYHPLFLFNGHGDCVAAKLRPGNASSADDWEELLVPEIDRQQALGQRVAFRAKAAFARPAIYEALEARGVQYAIRIPANNNLELAVEDILFRSPGRPSLSRSFGTKVSSIRRTAGPRPDESWRKSNTTPASCSRASASW